MEGSMTKNSLAVALIAILLTICSLQLVWVDKAIAESSPLEAGSVSFDDSALTTQDDSRIVFVPRTGSKYHFSSTCSGMRNPRSMSLGEAAAKGYAPCSKCVGAQSAPAAPAPEPEPAPQLPSTGFWDVPDSHWVATEGWLSYVLQNSLMSGYAGTQNFGPEDDVTRGQVVVILFRYAQPDSKATTDSASYESNATALTDNASGQYYTAAVNWAVKNGIVTGYSGTTLFGPNDPVTREQLALILMRYLMSIAPCGFDRTSYQSAPDAAAVSSWATNGIAWAFANKVMTGVGTTGALVPGGHASRAAMAKMITVTLRDALPAAQKVTGVAATVNTTSIPEEAVTNYIASFRQSNGLTDDAVWKAWLAANNVTAEKVRANIIASYIDRALVSQAAQERGVATEKALMESVVAEKGLPAMSDDDLVKCVKRHASSVDGRKRSSHILLSSADAAFAQNLIEQIKAGTIDFADAASLYSLDSGSAARGGDVGWDVGYPFVSEYQAGLDKLALNEVSGPVESEFGIHIIKCTEVFDSSSVTSAAQIPEAVATYAKKLDVYDAWFAAYKAAAAITVNLIPYGVPYDV